MARLLSVCLVLTILSALVMECESKRIPMVCCYQRGCLVKGYKCCNRRSYCKATRGSKKGHCRRKPKVGKGRDAEEAEEDIEVPDSRELEEDNAPIDFLDTLMNP